MTFKGPVSILYCENNVDGTIGGSYYSLLYLLKGLDRARFSPIAVFYTDHSLVPAYREAGVETIIWPRRHPFTFGSELPGWLRWARPAVLAFRKAVNFSANFLIPALSRAWFLRRRGVLLVHLNNSVLYNHDWMLAARLAGVRCVTHERGINERYPRAARYFGRRLDAVICISEAVKDNMRRKHADFGNLVTIHNGLDPEMMRQRVPVGELRQQLGLPSDAPVVVMTGNLKAWKGQDTLIRAMDSVRRRCPRAQCVLVGDTSPSDREYEATLRELVTSLGLETHVHFAGFQRQVADFLTMSDVVVHASVLPEPFGRVILEAMACRKPVIGARAGAIPEIIEEGITGLTFRTGDAEALGQAIVAVLTDRERARTLGENGYTRLIEQFHIARNVAATQGVYERLLSADH